MVAPDHRRLARYTHDGARVEEIAAPPVDEIASVRAHLSLWVPDALLPDRLKRVEEPLSSRCQSTSKGESGEIDSTWPKLTYQ